MSWLAYISAKKNLSKLKTIYKKNKIMNYKTNYYGLVGLLSTIGKNSFTAGEQASCLGKNTCHYIRKVVELDVVVVGKVFERLENTFESIENFDKSAKEWFKEKETSYNKKYELAKTEEDWEEVNKTYANVEAEPKVHINLEEDQSCLRNWNNNSYKNTLPSFFFKRI
jgi:hypothetical protein